MERSVTFPYRHRGKACFHVQPNVTGTGHGQFGFRSAQSAFECTKCYPAVPIQTTTYQCVLEHNGAHILFDESLMAADQPCGLCLRPFPMCIFAFQKRAGSAAARQIDWETSTCLNPLKFQMAAAMKSTEGSPCTNYLLQCPLQCGMVVWTYNLPAHYKSSHKLKSTDNLPVFYKMADLEMERMKTIWETRQNYPTKRATTNKKKAKAALRISDAHRSIMAMRRLEEENPARIRPHVQSEDDEPSDHASRIPTRRAHRAVVQDSDSESYDGHSETSVNAHPVKLEASDPPHLMGSWDWNVDGGFDELEYYDEPVSIPAIQPLEDDDLDRQLISVLAPSVDNLPASRESSEVQLSAPVLPSPPVTTHALEMNSTDVASAPTAGEIYSVDSDVTVDRSRGRPARKKRKAAQDVECICGKEVTLTERELSAVQCARAGCETIWFHVECVPADI
ncbi:hypothetical protein K438DRAFT_2031344 [Mycena galopus ATCC 62051]|nr:hypothetical protein K438DRAFT_2031344 [Mycena galopus ATCC 62051]